MALALATLALALVACGERTGTEAAASGSEWVGTVTTEGDVTTVVNESGSVWGGDAQLVEELSIGVEAGADEYMFGTVRDVWATDDRIYVLDSQVPVVRVYDHGGTHVMDVGREGQGPGEYADPGGLVVTDEGDVVVVQHDLQVDVFGNDGTPKATWNSGSLWSIGMPEMIVLGFEGEIWVPGVIRDPVRFGRTRIGPDGSAGEVFLPPDPEWESTCLTYQRNGRESRYCNIPFWPNPLNALLLDGGWAVGINDEYAFELQRADGRTLRVERFWDPVPVSDEEAAHSKQQTIDFLNERMGPDTEYVWNGPEIPVHKEAFVQLIPDRDGRVWVLREQQSLLSTDCADGASECWVPAGYWLDAFGPDGRFLGSTTLQQRPAGRPFIDGETMVIVELDEAGTYMVKKYRLALPEGATSE